VVQWLANGVPISTAANYQQSPTIVSDGGGGAIITWFDYRSGTNYAIYAQRIDASGALGDPPTGVPTMNEWGMIIFMIFAGLSSVYYMKRREKA
jgi:hypothetical protein